VTNIQFTIKQDGYVCLDIYNNLGRRVAILADGYYRSGAHLVKWDASQVPSGTYFYRLRTCSFSETKRMVVLK
jgi:hypothetical protein